MTPIDLLIKPPTRDEVFDKLLDVLERVDIPARSWREGGVARSILAAAAEVGAMGAAVGASVVAGFFLSFGKGDYLANHVKDVYDVDKIGATFATGKLTLTNEDGGVFTIGADELVARSSRTKARFRISQAFVLSSGSEASPTSIDVSIVAIEPGSASSVAPGDIDELETPLAKVTVSNAASIIGRDAESDPALVKRTKAKKGMWSEKGPRDAYEHAALTALLPDGTPTSITRVSVSRYDSKGRVTVVCATPTGTPSDAELDAVRANIEAKVRPDTVRVDVFGAVPKATAKKIRIWARGGTESSITTNAQAALATMISEYPIGGIAKTDGGQGYLYDDLIDATVIGSARDKGYDIFDTDIIDGAGDVPLQPNEVATNTTLFEVRSR